MSFQLCTPGDISTLREQHRAGARVGANVPFPPGEAIRGPSRSSTALDPQRTEIPIERRDSREVTHIEGWSDDGRRVAVRLTPQDSPAANYAFDVTPARLVTGLITERGVCPASRAGLLELFPEHRD